MGVTLPPMSAEFKDWLTTLGGSGPTPGPQSYNPNDVYGGILPGQQVYQPNGAVNLNKDTSQLPDGGNGGIDLNLPRTATSPTWASPWGTPPAASPIPSIPAVPIGSGQAPRITVAGANPISPGAASSYAPAAPSAPALGAATAAARPAGNGMRAVTIGGYNYLTGTDGKLINGADGKPMNMGRAGLPAISTGMIGGMIKNATGADPMTGTESLMAQGVMPPIPKPPVNQTGVLPNGSTFVNGVKTGVGGDMQFLTPAQRDRQVLAIEQQNGFNAAPDPQAAAARARLEAGSQGTIDTGFTSGTQYGEGAANIAQKVKNGQLSLQAAMAQGYHPQMPNIPVPPAQRHSLIGSRL